MSYSGADIARGARENLGKALAALQEDPNIPDDVLASPRRAPVNYHDAPLPRYAGMHATSWELMHGETRHAVTWHEVVAEVQVEAEEDGQEAVTAEG